MCDEFNFDEAHLLEDAVKEYLFDLKMKPIIETRLNDGMNPIPVNLEDLL